MRLLQAERKAVGLGDGVYLLYWDADKQRVRIKTYDPGFYFPVLDEDADGSDYPRPGPLRVGTPEDKKRGLPARLRRITYHLDWIRPLTASGGRPTGRPVRAPSCPNRPTTCPAQPVLGTRRHPRRHRGDPPACTRGPTGPRPRRCYLTDATWELGDLKGNIDVDDLPMDEAHFASNPRAKSSTASTC
jgi:hypothetical protein